MSKTSQSQATPFYVVGAVQYEMKQVENRAQEIADWVYMYYSHTVEDPTEEKKISKKLQKQDCFEDEDKIYLFSPPTSEQ
jgi:hypothetical protein